MVREFLYETGQTLSNRVSPGGEAHDRRRMADAQQPDVFSAAFFRKLSKTVDPKRGDPLFDLGGLRGLGGTEYFD